MTTMHIPHYRKVAHVTSINTGSASPLISSNFQSTLELPTLRGYEPWCLMTKSRSSSPTRCQTRSQTAHTAANPQTSTPPPSSATPPSGTVPLAQPSAPTAPATFVTPSQSSFVPPAPH